MNTPPTHRARVGDALDLLHQVLRPYIEREMSAVYKGRWIREARSVLHGKAINRWDTSDLLTIMFTNFNQVFRSLGHEARSWVSLLREVRKKWAHQGTLTVDETRRTLETTILLLRAIGAKAEAASLEPHVLELMQHEVQQRLQEADPEPGLPDHLSWVNDTRASMEAVQQGPEPFSDADALETMDDEEDGLLSRGLQKIRYLFNKTPVEPLELRRGMLDAAERAAAPYRKNFAFNRLIVHILAEDDQVRQRFEAALKEQSEPFDRAVLRRLADARIPVPPSLNISWKFHRMIPQRLFDQFDDQLYCIELHRRKAVSVATLVVLKGKATEEYYVIKNTRPITIGRQTEVTDERGRIVWRNQVAFLDYEDPGLDEEEQAIHATISRVHARLQYDEAAAAFRLFDDHSTCGTSVVRQGYLVPFQVKQQPVALQDGDLIYLGKACLRFVLGRPR